MSRQPPAMLPEGTVIASRYELRGTAGGAGDRRLYRAVDGQAARPRAVWLEAGWDLRLPEVTASQVPATLPLPERGEATEDRGQQFRELALPEVVPWQQIAGRRSEDWLVASLADTLTGWADLLAGGLSLPRDAAGALLAEPDGTVWYAGPLADGAAPRPTLPPLAEALGPDGLWSTELRCLLDALAADQWNAALETAERLAEPLTDTVCAMASDIGRSRRRNEDVAGHLRWTLLAAAGPVDLEFLAVADGVGGQSDGHLAAAVAVSTFLGSLTMSEAVELLSAGPRLWHHSDAVVQIIERSLQAAAETVASLSEGGEGRPPATTMVTAVRCGRRLYLHHVGDSRAYLWRDGRLERLTSDHTVAQRLADQGQVAAEAVDRHPQAHVLTRHLGSHGKVAADGALRLLSPGDRLLLCSDGVSDSLSDAELGDMLSRGADAQALADRLVQAALQRDGHDNLTVGVMLAL